MNIRSLTRGDGAVIGAAVLLFIASFLDFYSADCDGAPADICDKIEMPNAWETDKLYLILPSVFLVGIIGAAIIAAGRFLGENRKVGALTLPQWGTALTAASLWSALWSLIAKPEQASIGIGAIIALLATIVLCVVAAVGPRIPALAAPLLGAGGPQPAPGPFQGGPQQGQPGGYGYPGGPQQGQPGPGPFGGPQQGQPGPQGGPFGGPQQGQPGQPQQAQAQQSGPGAPGPAAPGPAAPGPQDANFQPFWFAVPVARPLFAEDGSPQPVAELAPGTWYLAVEQRGQALVAQTQDGRRGILQDTSGIQRG